MIPGLAYRGVMCLDDVLGRDETLRMKIHDSRSCLSGGDVLGRGEALRRADPGVTQGGGGGGGGGGGPKPYGLKAPVDEGSVFVENPENERPPRTVDFSTKKSHF